MYTAAIRLGGDLPTDPRLPAGDDSGSIGEVEVLVGDDASHVESVIGLYVG